MGEPWHASTGFPPAVTLRRLIFGHRVAQIVATAAQLGIADHMGNTKMSAAELAPLVHAEEHALRRLLRALASIAVLSEEEDGRFSLTPLGHACRQMHPVACARGLFSKPPSTSNDPGVTYSTPCRPVHPQSPTSLE